MHGWPPPLLPALFRLQQPEANLFPSECVCLRAVLAVPVQWHWLVATSAFAGYE